MVRAPRSFTLRWVLGLALALAVVGTPGYHWQRDRLEDRLRAEAVTEQETTATAVSRAARRVLHDGRELTSVGPVLRALGDRPEVLSIELISSQGWVKAASLNTMVNKWRHSEPLTRALVDNRSVMTGGPGRSRDGRFTTLTPIELPAGRFVVLTERRDRRMQALVAELREGVLLLGVATFAGVMLVFWLTAGRALAAQHRAAVTSALRDGLTGLGNHRAFQEELSRGTSLARRRGEPMALLVLDMDDFKLANDRHGHHHGDQLLRTVADELSGGRVEDRAFRTGGDEFALLMAHSDEASALEAARRIMGALAQRRISVSIGVSATRPGMGDPQGLREEADGALYEGKRRGTHEALGYSQVHDSISVLTADRMLALEALLALPAVAVALQPIWDMESHALIGVEALARPGVGVLGGPAEAFDVAEQLGRIVELDMLCARSALGRFGDLPPGARMFVNLAPQTVAAIGDAAWLRDAAASAGVEPARIVVEITERMGARRAAILEGARMLREAGFGLALDDVGTGNAGLEMLAGVDLDFVKVDRSIVVGALDDPRAHAVLSAIIAFAAQTGAFVIAEGIEDERMLGFLRRLDEETRRRRTAVQGGQGYALGRPVLELGQALEAGVLALLAPA